MKASALIAVLLFLQQVNGCDGSKPKSASVKPDRPPTHRFDLIRDPPTPGMAIDTTTGQFCRTWDWVYTNNPSDKSFETLPTCISLFHENGEVVK